MSSMIGAAYLAAILVSGACVLLVDRRYRLFVFDRPRRAAAVVAAGTVFFLAWDLVGIHQGLFLLGDGAVLSGVVLAPELPIEELFFLAFLSLLTMVIYTGARRVLLVRSARQAAQPTAGGAQ